MTNSSRVALVVFAPKVSHCYRLIIQIFFIIVINFDEPRLFNGIDGNWLYATLKHLRDRRLPLR